MGLAVTVGLVGAIFLGLQWLLYACLLPFVGGAVLVGLGWLSMKYFYRRHERHREAIWTNLAAHSDKLRDINVYPFADHAQLRHAQIKCPHAYAPVPIPAGVERDADAARMADQASQAKLRAEQQQQARLVELTEALRANPGRCPNCGSKRFGRKPSDESEPSLVVAERRCKDCGCEWKPPWTRGDVITAIIAGAFLVLLLLCGCVLLAYSGFLGKADLSRARSWVALLVVFGSLVWLGGAGVRMIWLAIGRLRRERCLGHALKPGEPDGGE